MHRAFICSFAKVANTFFSFEMFQPELNVLFRLSNAGHLCGDISLAINQNKAHFLA